MVFDPKLGYDPEEWEECEDVEHFLVFSPFTRIVLTVAAIAFVYYFFKAIENNKNKGKEKVEEEAPQQRVEKVLEQASFKLNDIQHTKKEQEAIPSTLADDLVREADQYLQETVKNGRAFVDQTLKNNFPEKFEQYIDEQPKQATQARFEQTLNAVDNHLREVLEMPRGQKPQQDTKILDIPPQQIITPLQQTETPILQQTAPDQQQRSPQTFQEFYQQAPPSFAPVDQQITQEQLVQKLIGGQQQAQYQQQQHEQKPPVPQHRSIDKPLPQELDIYFEKEPKSGNAAQRYGQRPQAVHPDITGQYEQFGQQQAHPQQQAQDYYQLQQHQFGQLGQAPGFGQPQNQQSQFAQHPNLAHQGQFGAIGQPRPTIEEFASLHAQPPQVPPRRITREKRLSEQDERALQEWEEQKAWLENDRLKNLLDVEAGGESSTDLSNSAKAYDLFAPASHISYESRSEDRRAMLQPLVSPSALNQQAEKLRSQVEQIAHPQPTNIRDSQLTDYDISDFHGPIEETRFEPPHTIGDSNRRTTGDSDEYVKVTAEPIYDYPPKAEKTISPQEAAQLQELCQEYDFGLDLPGVEPSKPSQSPTTPKPFVQDRNTVNFVGPFGASASPWEVTSAPEQQSNVRFQQKAEIIQRQDSLPKENIRNVPITIKTTTSVQKPDHQEYQIPIQKGNRTSGGFVIEEEMLSSQGATNKKSKPQSAAAEATCHQVKTTDVFERIEHDEHDDMTYAPEIQSVEIPPDQMSESSENLLEYFDRVAAESQQIADLDYQQNTLKKTVLQGANQKPQTSGASLKPVGQAPQILPAFGNRAPSNSSLASSGRRSGRSHSGISSDNYPYHLRKQSSLLSVLGVTSMQEMLLTITSLDTLSDAMRKAGLETTNLIFGIDYTASNKYQGEESFGGRSLHTIHPNVKNPYQQVITILGRTLAPFASTGRIGVYGFGDAKTGDWGVFNVKKEGDCSNLEEVLQVYNQVTPTISLSGPTNFAPLIYQAMEICQKARDYHILVIIADGQVTNEKATRRAIVQACQHPLSIIVVGVGDGPWDMMRVFDESLPKRPWDNFHFVEYHDIIKRSASVEDGDVKVAVQSLLEIPDQYRCICELGLLDRSIPPRGSEIRRELIHNPL